MNLLNLLFGRWSNRQKALDQYERGMAFAKQRDHKAALAEYTAVVESNKIPADLLAMALYNRAVVHSAMLNQSEAIRDLEKLLALPGAPAGVRLEAKRKLVRMERATRSPQDGPNPDR